MAKKTADWAWTYGEYKALVLADHGTPKKVMNDRREYARWLEKLEKACWAQIGEGPVPEEWADFRHHAVDIMVDGVHEEA